MTSNSSTSRGGVSRRQFIGTGVGALSAAAAACWRSGAADALVANDALGDVDLILRARPASVAIDPNLDATRVLRFEGERVGGGVLPQTGYLGPTLRVRPGERLRVRFENGLDEPSIIHWHGLDVSQENDGHPRLAVGSGEAYRYDFRVDDRPGLYWYHPHPHGRTGPQVYAGLAGLLLIEDPDDEARGLPVGEHDVAMVLQDRQFDPRGQLVYRPDPMAGKLGDRILVNGRPDASFDVRAGTYRLRLLNGSNARLFKLAWSDGRPVTVIGTDGGLLAAPRDLPYVTLAPAERADVWVDFSGVAPGATLRLESRSFSTALTAPMNMGRGMMGRGGMGRPGLPNGSAFPVCGFRVNGDGVRLARPTRLSPVVRWPDAEVANLARPKQFDLSMMMMRFSLNGRTFEMTDVADNERITLGVTEDWEFSNPVRMMTMAHPVHLHAGQFQVVGRAIDPAWRAAADTVGAGLLDEGWKDTVLVRPGERVRIRVRFDRHPGLFLYHCHILEHEDQGMMRNFLVEA